MKTFAPVPLETSALDRGGLPSAPAAVEACLHALERVEGIVEHETHALKAGEPVDLAGLNHRKNHGLLELSRAMRGVDRATAAPWLAPSLQRLKAKLAENSAALAMHIEAVKEVAAVMSRAIRDGDSDGTYSASIRCTKA